MRFWSCHSLLIVVFYINPKEEYINLPLVI